MANLKFDTVQTLALAIAAYRQSNNNIVRKDGNTPGNKELVVDFLINNKKFQGSDAPDLLDEAENLKTALSQQIVMNTLANRPTNEFLLNVNNAIVGDTVSMRDIGLIVWAPKLLNDIEKAEHTRNDLLKLSFSSQHLGKIKDRVELTFTLVSQRYLKNYDLFIHTGHDEKGNLVNFFNKSKIESGCISARIKQLKKDNYINGADVTVLNYVKVVK
jgi:hypothetical protein